MSARKATDVRYDREHSQWILPGEYASPDSSLNCFPAHSFEENSDLFWPGLPDPEKGGG